MKTEYPKLIYNNNNRTCCTVLSLSQHEALKGYFSDELDHGLLPYVEIDLSEAMRIHEEVKEEVSDSEILNYEPEPVLHDPGFPGMTFKPKEMGTLTWHELRGYGKEVERAFGVELPLRAKRDLVEKSIQEVLNGDDSKRCS